MRVWNLAMASKSSKPRTDNEEQNEELDETENILQGPASLRPYCVYTHRESRGTDGQST